MEKSPAGQSQEKVMIVVPALPKSDNGYKPIITALVPGIVFLFSQTCG